MIIAIVGPTGIGKTKLSILLAKKYNGIVVNCDAMQVYKEMNIGTAKIKEEEKEGIPHYLFDIKSVNDNYTVFDYQRDLRDLINKNKDRNIIIVGGTGFYLKAALYNYEFKEFISKNNYENITNLELKEMVNKQSPDVDVHVNNRRRLISILNREGKSYISNELLYDTIFIGLTIDRKTLYKKVEDRVDEMIASGLIEEAKDLYDKNIFTQAINTAIGYKELYKYFKGEISFEDAVNLIKKNTRHYIKRQYTWFNNKLNVKWFNSDLNNFTKTINEITNYIETLDKQSYQNCDQS